MALMGAVFLAFPEFFIRLYTSDPEVVRLGAVGMRVVGLGQPFQAAAFVLGGALRGAGATRSTFIVGTLGVWLARVPCAYALGHLAGWGVGGVWAGWAADWLLRGSVLLHIFWRGSWQK
jgi:Na+-driven multidrug efflux pump